MSQLALAHPLLQIKEKEKEKKNNIQNQKKRKRKEILNNDLAVLPSHNKVTTIVPHIKLPISWKLP